MGILEKELFIRYFSGRTSDSENDLIESWIAETDENKQILEQYYFIWQTSEYIHVMQSVNTHKALSSFNEKIRVKEMNTRFSQYFLWTRRVAVTLFVAALLLSHLYDQKSDNESQIQYVEMKTNPGVVSSVILPDCTKVWINSCSSLKYPVRFAENKREVVLDGEGYFEVMKDAKTPFLVRTRDNYAVEVLGTKFNVKAYSGEKKIETTLVEGSVGLNINATERKQMQYVLKPNQKGIYENGLFSVQWVEPIYEMGWIDGKMYFKNLQMKEVINRLSRHYNVTFDVKDRKVLESSITAKFESEQLLQIMEYIRLASGIKYKVHEVNIEGDKLNKMIIDLTK